MNTPQDPIIVGVHRCVREALHIAGAITPEMKFVDDMGADSLDKTEFVLAIEDEFEIIVPDDVEFATVQAAVDYVKQAVGERA